MSQKDDEGRAGDRLGEEVGTVLTEPPGRLLFGKSLLGVTLKFFQQSINGLNVPTGRFLNGPAQDQAARFPFAWEGLNFSSGMEERASFRVVVSVDKEFFVKGGVPSRRLRSVIGRMKRENRFLQQEDDPRRIPRRRVKDQDVTGQRISRAGLHFRVTDQLILNVSFQFRRSVESQDLETDPSPY